MKVLQPSMRLTDIGPLDGVMELPMAPRIRCGQRTTCRRCGKRITDETFAAGFKKGLPNMLFHVGCLDEETTAMLKAREETP